MDERALEDLRPAVAEARQRFLKTIEGLRPDLFRLARGLTPTVWEAEDLVQETLARAFANLGRFDRVRSPRAYLFRIATNAWLDEQARRRPLSMSEDLEVPDESPSISGAEVREALETLARTLPPRQRAAVLLRDVFGFTLAETAQTLATTVGAVKAALFRGRTNLATCGDGTVPESRRPMHTGLVDAFIEAFNARDLEALLSLMAPEATTEIVGVAANPGPDAARDAIVRTLEEEGLLRAESVAYEGERIVVLWYREEGGSQDAIGDLLRFEAAGGRITRYRSYYFAPEVLEAVGAATNLPVRTQGRCLE